MDHPSKNTAKKIRRRAVVVREFLSGVAIGLIILFVLVMLKLVLFERSYRGKIYPAVSVGEISFGGRSPADVEQYWESQNEPFKDVTFEFRFEDKIATLSGTDLKLGYDAALSATQAFLVGRSRYFFSNITARYLSSSVNLEPYLRYDTQLLDDTLAILASEIDIPEEDALFEFAGGKVISFRPSRNGRRLNQQKLREQFQSAVFTLPKKSVRLTTIQLPVDIIEPRVETTKTNSYGIKELIGRGYSEFKGSIPGRIHNVALAASKFHGVLIPPGETLSFNETVGDISAATGYQSAYIIKNGRTVLGDGGGVCQVSSTVFRAALAAGLPIIERHPHAYRVHYYEEPDFKAGLDATVFAPSVDLKIQNDTPGYILIQVRTDLKNLTLTFDFYGTKDGRKAEIINHTVGGISAPPPPLYQDDPTLPPGAVKQVDFSAWGAVASFAYRVTRGTETLQEVMFRSAYRPWQAVFLRGPQP